MQFFIEKISKLRIKWNKKPLTEEDFYRLCKRYRIGVEEMPLKVSGFYYCVKGRHFIAIDSRLKPHKKLFVMFHEFAHYLMHAPDRSATANFHGVGVRTRKEIEADAFALCSLIPKTWIECRTLNELHDYEGFAYEMLRERLAIFESYGI